MQSYDGIHECFEGDVQYPYADVGQAELMHISAVTPENRREYTYTCPYCKKALRPRLGTKRAHCYAHRPGESCELDRYIHSTAERLLKEKWERDEPFEISMNVHSECRDYDNCLFRQEYNRVCKGTEMKTFDLKKQFSQCLVEKKFGEFIPDLCLVDESGRHEPIFIEIWSKHKNSQKKADSEYRIIEIRLRTTEELEALPGHPITESETVTFSHFKTLNTKPDGKEGPRLRKYTLYSGTLKSFVDETYCNCGNYKSRHHAKALLEVVCSQDEIYSSQEFRNYCNALAIERGFDIRSCYLCQLYGADKSDRGDYDWNDNWEDRPVGCRRDIKNQGLIQTQQEEAKTCEWFKLKDIPLKQAKARYGNINRYLWHRREDGSYEEEFHKRKTWEDYRNADDSEFDTGFE